MANKETKLKRLQALTSITYDDTKVCYKLQNCGIFDIVGSETLKRTKFHVT